MQLGDERVELLIDPETMAWVREPVDEARRRSCMVYVAWPRERRMGKVGGEAPRPLRWLPGPPPPPAAALAEGRAGRSVPAEGSGRLPAPAAGQDPLMFTAGLAGGTVLSNSVFERLQLGVAERFAGYRYSAGRCAPAEPLWAPGATRRDEASASVADAPVGVWVPEENDDEN